MKILEGTPLKNHPNLESLAYNTFGKAAGLAGVAVDTASEPYQVLAGILTGGSMKAMSPLEDMMANTTKNTLKKFGIDLSDKRAVRGIAEGMDDAVKNLTLLNIFAIVVPFVENPQLLTADLVALTPTIKLEVAGFDHVWAFDCLDIIPGINSNTV